MKIAIATDHNGSELKKEIIKFLKNRNVDIVDLSPSNSPVDDYPDYAFTLCKSIVKKEEDLGILMCGTGIGMSIAANKVKGIRCAHVTNTNDAFLARQHNNANVLAVGSKLPLNEILKIIDIFVNTGFSNEDRHVRRIKKIMAYENGEYNG
jgi:RpiB/LacA/LacB family sugar-phosphate isomerase